MRTRSVFTVPFRALKKLFKRLDCFSTYACNGFKQEPHE